MESERAFNEVWPEMETALDAASASTAGRPDDEGVLTFSPADWFPPDGGGARLPAVRIQLSAVLAWWVAGSVAFAEQESGGGGWFVDGFIGE